MLFSFFPVSGTVIDFVRACYVREHALLTLAHLHKQRGRYIMPKTKEFGWRSMSRTIEVEISLEGISDHVEGGVIREQKGLRY